MLADFMSKPLLGDELLDKVLWAVGCRYYPPPESLHYDMLQLKTYPVGVKRIKETTVMEKCKVNDEVINEVTFDNEAAIINDTESSKYKNKVTTTNSKTTRSKGGAGCCVLSQTAPDRVV